MNLWDRLKINFSVIYFLALFLLVFSFSGCKTNEVLKEIPVEYIYISDIKNKVCSEFQITDKATLKARRTAEYPLSYCDGNVGMKAIDYLNLKTYIRKIQGG